MTDTALAAPIVASGRPQADVLLSVRDLTVSFGDEPPAVRGLSLDVGRGEVLGVVGQSGSGKSVTALAAMGLLPDYAKVNGSILFEGVDVLGHTRAHERLRGSRMSMIFQETMTALNPIARIRHQMMLAVRANTACSKAEARDRCMQALHDVKLQDVDRVMESYPHQLSGGMCQRVMIAMALACGSDMLFADESTTALNVTVQREVIDLIRGLVDSRGLSVMFISHDIGVIDELSDRVVVVFRGKIVEAGESEQIINRPQHPYTRALLQSVPRLAGGLVEFPEIEFSVEGDDA